MFLLISSRKVSTMSTINEYDEYNKCSCFYIRFHDHATITSAGLSTNTIGRLWDMIFKPVFACSFTTKPCEVKEFSDILIADLKGIPNGLGKFLGTFTHYNLSAMFRILAYEKVLLTKNDNPSSFFLFENAAALRVIISLHHAQIRMLA